MATSSAREARRRKITERGSDRLALISGRIQSLSPSPTSPPPPDLLFHSDPPPNIPIEDKASLYTLREPDHIQDEADNGAEAITSLAARGADSRSPLLSSEGLVAEPRARKRLSLRPRQISSAIAATERTRLLCSVVFSVLVVLSGLGFPVLGSGVFKSVPSFRPLYTVLATNVAIVIARLLEKRTGSGIADRGESGNREDGNGSDVAEKLGKALEIGLLLQKAADAVFMDCAVYSVIVVCGLTFALRF